MFEVAQGMKRDGRTLGHETLEEMRKLAVQRMNEGERAAVVAASFGMHRSWAFKCRAAARGKGLRALRSKKASGRPRKLSVVQERQVFRWVNGKNPQQYGFDFGLWTRQIVRSIACARTLGHAAVPGQHRDDVARLGLTAQTPLQRAYQRDPQAIEQWQRVVFPTLAAQARREGAQVFFRDESGFRADAVHGKTWGRRGQTPVVDRPGAPEHQRRLGRQLQGRLLVPDLCRRADGRTLRGAAARTDASTQEGGASGCRWLAGAQEGPGQAVRCEHRGKAHAALSARIRAGAQSGRTGVESRQANRRGTPAAAQGREVCRQ